jgi:hypothetical protein
MKKISFTYGVKDTGLLTASSVALSRSVGMGKNEGFTGRGLFNKSANRLSTVKKLSVFSADGLVLATKISALF